MGTPEADSSGSAELTFAVGLRKLCTRCRRETGFLSSELLLSVARCGGLETARLVLKPDGLRYGFETLCELGRPDLTLEAYVLASGFRDQFSIAEIELASERVAACEALKRRRRIAER